MWLVAELQLRAVWSQDVANSACLGAAYLARLGRCRSAAAAAGGDAAAVTFDTVTAAAEPFQLACEPRPDAQQVLRAAARR